MTITIPSGLEARPVALLVQVASQFESNIHIQCENKQVNAKSIMGMMSLGIAAGEEVEVTIQGSDEEAAMKKIEEYLNSPQ